MRVRVSVALHGYGHLKNTTIIEIDNSKLEGLSAKERVAVAESYVDEWINDQMETSYIIIE
jgi:hypothetical protein